MKVVSSTTSTQNRSKSNDKNDYESEEADECQSYEEDEDERDDDMVTNGRQRGNDLNHIFQKLTNIFYSNFRFFIVPSRKFQFTEKIEFSNDELTDSKAENNDDNMSAHHRTESQSENEKIVNEHQKYSDSQENQLQTLSSHQLDKIP